MLKKNKLGLRVRFSFVLREASGLHVASWAVKNLVVNAGKAEAAALLGGLTADPFTYLAIGEGSTAAALTDTTLETEITTGGGERAAAAVSRVTTDVTNDTLQLVKTFTFSSSFVVTEAGVFNDPAAGDMLARAVFTGHSVVSTNTLLVTYKVDLD